MRPPPSEPPPLTSHPCLQTEHTTSPNVCQENECSPTTGHFPGRQGRKTPEKWLADHRALLDRQKIAQAEAYQIAGFHAKSRDILECGHLRILLHCHDCRQDKAYTKTCKDRLCPSCLETKLFKLTQALEPILTQVQRAKLLTLTIKSTPTLTKPAVTALIKSFDKLRHRKAWTRPVSGGIYGLDYSWTDAGCHQHIHALLDADYLPLQDIRILWQDYYPGAWNQDIRQVDASQGISHVVKYALRGANFLQEPDRLRQFIAVMHGRRTFSTFGSFYRACREDKEAKKAIDVLELTDEEFLDFLSQQGRIACPDCGGHHTERLGITLEDPLTLPPRQLELQTSHERTKSHDSRSSRSL